MTAPMQQKQKLDQYGNPIPMQQQQTAGDGGMQQAPGVTQRAQQTSGQYNYANPVQQAVQSDNAAYQNPNPYATPDNQQYWNQQDQIRNQNLQGITNKVGSPAVSSPAAQLNQSNAPGQMLNTINDQGKIALQGVQGSLQTQQIATQAKQLKSWQDQQQQAYKTLQSQYGQQLTAIQAQYASQIQQSQYGGNYGNPNGVGAGLTSQTAGATQSNTGGTSTPYGVIKPGQYDMGNNQDNQIAMWARQAGFGESSIPMVVAIAHAESGGVPTAINDKNANGSTDWGLMQINSIHSDLLSQYDKFNPVDNLKMAFQISGGGTNWQPWVTWQNGDVNKYLQNTPTMVTSQQTFGTAPVSGSQYGGQVNSTTSGLRMNMVNTAMKYLGTPYVFGGDSLTSGIDCSGLVHEIYKQFGFGTPRTANDDAHPEAFAQTDYGGTNVSGSRVNISQLQPGDLVAWQGGYRGPDLVGHVAIYAGNGQIIEAPDVNIPVRRRSLRADEHDVSMGGNLIGIHINLPGG